MCYQDTFLVNNHFLGLEPTLTENRFLLEGVVLDSQICSDICEFLVLSLGVFTVGFGMDSFFFVHWFICQFWGHCFFFNLHFGSSAGQGANELTDASFMTILFVELLFIHWIVVRYRSGNDFGGDKLQALLRQKIWKELLDCLNMLPSQRNP